MAKLKGARGGSTSKRPTTAKANRPTVATRDDKPRLAAEFRTLQSQFLAIHATDPHDGETEVREFSAIFAKTFYRAGKAGFLDGLGFNAEFSGWNTLPHTETGNELWATLGGHAASAICHAMPHRFPTEPTAPRFQHVATITEQPLNDGVDRGRTPAAGPCVSSIEMGTYAPEDWRKRRIRFAAVCGFLADELSQEAPASGSGKSPNLLDDSAFWTHLDFAKAFPSIGKENARKRLDYWRKKNPHAVGKDFHENTDRRSRQPSYLYRVGAVKHLFAVG